MFDLVMIMARGNPQDTRRGDLSHLGIENRHVSLMGTKIGDLGY